MSILNVNWQQAATEFIVIVLGILAALAVDQWWSEREDRIIESEYLDRIHADLQADIDNFTNLERIFNIKSQTIEDLKAHPESGLFSRDAVEVYRALSYSGFVALPDSQSTTFDELMSTGRLALIESTETRDALSRYYSGFEHISEIHSEPVGVYKRLLFETLPPELLRNGRAESSVERVGDFHGDLELLLAHPDFPAAANAEIVYADGLLFYLTQYRHRAEDLLDLLSAKISED